MFDAAITPTLEWTGCVPDTDEVAGFEKPQQNALRSGRYILQLIEEQSSGPRCVEQPAMHTLMAPVNGTRLVTAHLGHCQVATECSAIDCDEGTVTPRTRIVYSLSKKLLPVPDSPTTSVG